MQHVIRLPQLLCPVAQVLAPGLRKTVHAARWSRRRFRVPFRLHQPSPLHSTQRAIDRTRWYRSQAERLQRAYQVVAMARSLMQKQEQHGFRRSSDRAANKLSASTAASPSSLMGHQASSVNPIRTHQTISAPEPPSRPAVDQEGPVVLSTACVRCDRRLGPVVRL